MLEMHDVRIGDRVQTMLPDGTTDYQEVYFLSHANAAEQGVFVNVTHVSNPRLHMAVLHAKACLVSGFDQ